jgi:hypothetical protein
MDGQRAVEPWAGNSSAEEAGSTGGGVAVCSPSRPHRKNHTAAPPTSKTPAATTHGVAERRGKTPELGGGVLSSGTSEGSIIQRIQEQGYSSEAFSCSPDLFCYCFAKGAPEGLQPDSSFIMKG